MHSFLGEFVLFSFKLFIVEANANGWEATSSSHNVIVLNVELCNKRCYYRGTKNSKTEAEESSNMEYQNSTMFSLLCLNKYLKQSSRGLQFELSENASVSRRALYGPSDPTGTEYVMVSLHA